MADSVAIGYDVPSYYPISPAAALLMKTRQAVITEPFKTAVREVELADPAANQILIAAEYSGVSAGTELAVYTGTHQWLKDPNLPDWKFPFRSGYSAAGRVLKVGKDFPGGFQEGDRVSFPGNHASAELLTVGHERCRVWKMPDNLSFDKAAIACISRPTPAFPWTSLNRIAFSAAAKPVRRPMARKTEKNMRRG